MIEEIKTVKMTVIQHLFLKSLQKSLEEVAPFPVTMGFATTFGSILGLQQLSKWKTEWSKDPNYRFIQRL